MTKKENSMTLGVFYEVPDGRIVYTYGWTGTHVRYYFDDNDGVKLATQEEFNTWTIRRDLKDFPNARDPRLPYVYDLLWDIKLQSQLEWALKNHPEREEIKQHVDEYGTKLE